jgi:hypothetical protein
MKARRKPQKAARKARRTKPGHVSYLLRNIDAETWERFCYVVGIHGQSAREVLLEFIENHQQFDT